MSPGKIFLLEVTGCSCSQLSLNVKPNMRIQHVLFLPRRSPLAKHSRYTHPGIAPYSKTLPHCSETKHRWCICLTAWGLLQGIGSKFFLWAKCKLLCTSNNRSVAKFPGKNSDCLPFEGKNIFLKHAAVIHVETIYTPMELKPLNQIQRLQIIYA